MRQQISHTLYIYERAARAHILALTVRGIAAGVRNTG
jgi:phosphoenolpyruvate carboxylase